MTQATNYYSKKSCSQNLRLVHLLEVMFNKNITINAFNYSKICQAKSKSSLASNVVPGANINAAT